jgi:hypothetical protein
VSGVIFEICKEGQVCQTVEWQRSEKGEDLYTPCAAYNHLPALILSSSSSV